jgi:hypothetical protein
MTSKFGSLRRWTDSDDMAKTSAVMAKVVGALQEGMSVALGPN